MVRHVYEPYMQILPGIEGSRIAIENSVHFAYFSLTSIAFTGFFILFTTADTSDKATK